MASDTSYRVLGGRTGVLLIHGLCGSPAEMRYVANGLARQGYSVVCPELAGHGGASPELHSATWLDWLASARRALDELSGHCDTVIVGGLSTGALLALILAAENPAKVSGVTLYSPTLWLNGRRVPWSLRIGRRLLAFRCIAGLFDLPAPQNYGIKDERMRAIVNAHGKGGATTPAIVALERVGLVKRVKQLLGAVRQPALILHPREDCLADLDNAFYLQRKLAGRAEMIVLDDSYHLVTLDRQRGLVLEATQRFIAGLPKRAAARGSEPAPEPASEPELVIA